MVYRKTIGKRMAAKPKDLRQNAKTCTPRPGHGEMAEIGGYLQYRGVPGNEQRMKAFRHEVLRMWWWQLRRRSQRTRVVGYRAYP